MTGWIVLAVVPPLVMAWLAGFAVRRLAPRFGLVDKPGHRKVHLHPTPLGGGIAIWAALTLTYAAGQIALSALRAGWVDAASLPEFLQPHLPGLLDQSGKFWLLWGAATGLMLLGLLDDRFGLDWKLRLGTQAAIAAFIAWQGYRVTAFVHWPLFTGLITVGWIVALINSFNMLDNMDGLSGGVASLAAAIMAGVVLLLPDPETGKPQWFVAVFLLSLVGAVLGFLWHNRPPARLFMGDAGSYLLGFWLATGTILATFTGGKLPRHAILAPLLALAVPLYDMSTVIWIRLREGRSPFVGDKSHFSHRLVELGMTKGQAVLTIYLTTATCGLGALLLYQVNAIGATIIGLLVLCVLTLIGILESTGRRRREETASTPPRDSVKQESV